MTELVGDLAESRYLRGSRIILLCHAVILSVNFGAICLYFVLGGTIYFDQQTFWLSCCWIVSLAFLALLAYWRGIHAIDMVLLWIYMFALPRLAQYLISPGTVVLPVGDMTVSEVNSGLLTGLSLTLAFFAAMAAIYLMFPPRVGRRPATMPLPAMLVLLVAYVGMLWLETMVYSGMGASVYSLELFEKANIPQSLKVFLTVVSADVFLFGIMYWFVARRGTLLGRVQTWAAVLVSIVAILAYNYAGVLAGSRSAGFRVLLYAAALGVVLGPRVPQAILRCVLLAAIAVATNVLLIPSAHEARDLLIQGESTVNVGAGMSALSPESDSVGETQVDAAMRIINRFGYLDYMVIATAREPDATCRARYLEWGYYAHNVANFLAPGDPYPDARLNTSNAFGICYRGTTEEKMPAYHSEIWTLPGVLSLMFHGQLVLPVAFAIGLVAASISRLLQQMSSLTGRMIYIFWIYMLPFCLYFTMGVDHTVNTYITFALRLTGMAALLQLAILAGRPWSRGPAANPTEQPSAPESKLVPP